MALHSVVEVALHFESFRNIDLFHQGLYHVKARIYREENDTRLPAVPYSFFACPTQMDQPKPKPDRTDHHHLIPAHIIEEQCTFSTRSFLIRYCEEEVELNDIGQFRIELSADDAAQDTPLMLEVNLMFADLTQHGGADRFGEQPDVDSTEFKSVSTQLFRVRGADHGLHEFCPVVFDEFHFCLVNLVLHSALIDFRLRLRPLQPVPTRPNPQASDGGNADKVPSPPPSNSHDQKEAAENGTRQNPALSLAECLFGNCRGCGRDQLVRVAEGLYQRHLGVLAASYARQAAWLDQVCNECLTPPQREALADAAEASELRLPNGVPAGKILGTADRSPNAPPDSGDDYLPNGHGTMLKSLIKSRLSSAVTEQTITMHLARDMNLVSCQVLELWHKVLNVTSFACRETAALLRASWERRISEQWGVSIVKETLRSDIADPEDKNIWDSHNQKAENLRKTLKPRLPEAVEDVSLMPSTGLCPILFEQNYEQSSKDGKEPSPMPERDQSIPSAPKPYRGVHLFVLVHGFQGNSFDMRLMKNNIALLYPDAIFLCSNSNEDNTEGDFNEMGIRLAQEVVNYICDWCPGSALGRLSFIAHSIGGLIVRAALPLLHEYSSKMFTFLTFSTAHVGYFLKNISLFHMGLRVLQSWRQSMCLAQLSMTDSPDPKETFLYRLSKTKGFEFFQNIVLVSCPSDQYGPFDSARVEVGSMVDKHSNKEAYISMVHNLWAPVKPERVFRFDVNFQLSENNLDTFIGRAAHIQFLECQPIMKMIIHNYSFLFR